MAIDIDRERLAYVMAARLGELEISQAQLARLTGATTRQISFIKEGRKVEAGAVIVICLALEIDMAGLFSGPDFDRLAMVLNRLESPSISTCACETGPNGAKNHELKQPVTPDVSRETRSARPQAVSGLGAGLPEPEGPQKNAADVQ